MNLKNLTSTALIIYFSFLTGCDLSFQSSIYTRDLSDIIESDGKNVTEIPTQILIPALDKKKKTQTKILKMMKGVVNDPVFKGWKEGDFEDFAIIETKCKINLVENYEDENAKLPLGELLSFYVTKSKEFADKKGNKHHSLFLKLNQDSFSNLQEKIENEYHQEIDFSDVSISFEVVNDLRKDFSFILPNDCHVDSNGYLAVTEDVIRAEPRNNFTVEMTNVFSSYLKQNGKCRILLFNDL